MTAHQLQPLAAQVFSASIFLHRCSLHRVGSGRDLNRGGRHRRRWSTQTVGVWHIQALIAVKAALEGFAKNCVVEHSGEGLGHAELDDRQRSSRTR
jgi:hypothetical protein